MRSVLRMHVYNKNMKGQSHQIRMKMRVAQVAFNKIFEETIKRNSEKISSFDKMDEDYYQFEYDQGFMSVIFIHILLNTFNLRTL